MHCPKSKKKEKREVRTNKKTAREFDKNKNRIGDELEEHFDKTLSTDLDKILERSLEFGDFS